MTKGSFYWHFTDRGELLACLLEYWEKEHTDRLADLLANGSSDPRGQLLALLELVITSGADRYDASMRAWARHDPQAATFLECVDQKRLDYMRRLFLEMGFSEKEAHLRSRWSYYYLIGAHSVLATRVSESQRLDCARHWHRMLTKP